MNHDLLPRWPIINQVSLAMPALVAPRRNQTLAALVEDAQKLLLQSTPLASEHQRMCLMAGLWLLADDLEAAHKICQDVPTAHGSAWHAVLHRREGDFSNSLYWWRQARGLAWVNPVAHQSLADEISALLATGKTAELASAKAWHEQLGAHGYDPADFVRRVQADHAAAAQPWLETLLSVQRLEWLELFLQCWGAAQSQ